MICISDVCDKFVGSVGKIVANDGKPYVLKCPENRYTPVLLGCQGKAYINLTVEQYEKINELLENIVERSYPEWDKDSKKDFITQNVIRIYNKLYVIFGWISEKDWEESQKKEEKESPN